ncbi:MAG: tetraacyldisaccharide 4'-kinase [Rhodoferax sp.]
MQDALLRAWTRRGALAWLLWPVSMVFAGLGAARRGLYRTGVFKAQRVGARIPVVVVVGNVVAGGAGKTPVVIALVRHWQSRGLVVGVVSRGYGRRTSDCLAVRDDSPVLEVGDEPALIRRTTGAPVFVAHRRIEAARALLAAHPATQVIVSDDGLQHYALQRDIEICVFDDRGAGNGFLLPAGPLREPWPRPVDLVLHSGLHPAFAGYTGHRSLAQFAVRQDGTRLALAQLRGQPLAAVAAIAHPEGFFDMLRRQGLTLTQTIALPDHYAFDSMMSLPDKGYKLICTEKDALKLWRSRPDALAVPLQFEPEAAFLAAVDALLDAKLSSANTGS